MPPSNNTVPDVFGNVIVRSAVGSVTVKVVSNASAVAPSKVILEPLIVSEVAVILGISKAPLTFKSPTLIVVADKLLKFIYTLS